MNSYLKYSSLAVQMGVIIGAFAYLGYWLDGHYHSAKPWYTMGLSLLGVGLALFYVFKDFLKPVYSNNKCKKLG
jgi:F0F1-type ATP synthase assembly protein I